jgi:hypothetical protein
MCRNCAALGGNVRALNIRVVLAPVELGPYNRGMPGVIA